MNAVSLDLATAATLVYDGTFIFPFDLSCLDMNEEINNAVIDFYVKYLFRQWLNNEQRQRVQVLESVYLENMSKTISDGASARLDLLDKDFIVIPTRLREHWFLVILCYIRYAVFEKQDAKDKPRILIFDSAQKYTSSYRGSFLRSLRKLIQDAFARMLNTTAEDIGTLTKTLPHTVVSSPQQSNDIDCGLFLMENLERFLCNTFNFSEDVRMNILISHDHQDVESKRNQLKHIIATLASSADGAYHFDN